MSLTYTAAGKMGKKRLQFTKRLKTLIMVKGATKKKTAFLQLKNSLWLDGSSMFLAPLHQLIQRASVMRIPVGGVVCVIASW